MKAAVLLYALLCLRHLWSVAPIATSLVVPSTAGILSVFECPICQNLVEEPTVTACTHVFCCSCLDEWLQSFKARSSEPRCPSCQTGLGSRDSHAPLRLANPLAWRILSRVQLKCPLSFSGSKCSWVGDYSEVHSHLMKSDIHNADTLQRMPQQQGISKSKQYAEALKAQGNARFEARAFREASELYSKGLSAEPEDVALICNRAAAFLCDGKLNDCISDCRRAILLRANYVKAHQRLAQALCRRGSLAEAAAQLSRALSLVGAESGGQAGDQGEGLVELEEMHASCVHVIEALKAAEDKLERGDIKSARALVEAVVASETPGSFGTEKSPAVALTRARINVAAGVCHLAARQALPLLKDDEIELDVKSAALSVRGTALFFSGDTEQGLKHLKESLRLSPDVAATVSLFKRLCKVKAATEAAKDAQLKRDFRSEIEHWTLVLSLAHAPMHSPFRADALSSRAGAHLQLREFAAVYADCSAAMDCLDDCRDARLVRGKALVAQGKTQEVLLVL